MLSNYLFREIKWMVKGCKSLIATFVFIVLIAILMGKIYQGQMQREASINEIKIGWIDEDKSLVSQLVYANLMSDPSLSELLKVEKINEEDATLNMKENNLDAVLLIKSGFGDSLYYYGSPEIHVLLNENKPFKSYLLLNVLEAYGGLLETVDRTSYAFYLTNKELSEVPLAEDFLENSSTKWMLNALSKNRFFTEEIVGRYPSSSSQVYFFVSFLIFFAFLSSGYGMEEIVYIKQTSIIKRMRVTPNFFKKFILSKWIVQSTINILLFSISFVLLGKIMGQWYDLKTIVVSVVCMIIGFQSICFFISSCINDESSYIAIVNTVGILFAFLGGAFYPVSRMTDIIRKIAEFTPQYWYTNTIISGIVGFSLDRVSNILFIGLIISAFIIIAGYFNINRAK